MRYLVAVFVLAASLAAVTADAYGQENIFGKLGVHSRTAAVTRAFGGP